MAQPSKTNWIGLAILSSLWIIIGTSGFLAPFTNITSTTTASNVFHIVSGFIGFGMLILGRDKYIRALNMFFGALNLYLFMAGQLNFFPKHFFSFKPADDWFHMLLGITFMSIAYIGLRVPTTPRLKPNTP